MIQLSDEAVAQRLAWPALNAAIEAMVLSAAVAPPRHSYPLQGRRGDEGRLLIMPAWADDDVVGIKLVTVWPGNATLGLPSHGASYILLDARSGEVRATLAAEALTHRRTAAVSTLAASRLLPDTAERLLVVGAGPVAEQLVRAHAASGRFSAITLSGRAPDKVAALAAALGDIAVPCEIAHNLESAVRDADMVVGATSATSPWLRGDWLRPNAHVDLIGGFTPDMRESDDALMSRADAIWVDVLAAVDESGDLIQPIDAGVIDRAAIRGDFAALLARQAPRGPGITLFKSVGTAIADLAAARLILST